MHRQRRSTIPYQKERSIVSCKEIQDIIFDIPDLSLSSLPSFPNSGFGNILSNSKGKSSYDVTHLNNYSKEFFKNPNPSFLNIHDKNMKKNSVNSYHSTNDKTTEQFNFVNYISN